MREFDRDLICGGHMASGHMNRVKKPDAWLHRPMLQNVKKVLANPEPSTQEPLQNLKGWPKMPRPSPSASPLRYTCRSSIAPVFADVGFDFLGQRHELQRPGRIVAMRKRPLEELKSGVRRRGFACTSRYQDERGGDDRPALFSRHVGQVHCIVRHGPIRAFGGGGERISVWQHE